jgi:hypothetical protein
MKIHGSYIIGVNTMIIALVVNEQKYRITTCHNISHNLIQKYKMSLNRVKMKENTSNSKINSRENERNQYVINCMIKRLSDKEALASKELCMRCHP